MQKVLQKEGVPVRCLSGDQIEEMDRAHAGILSFWWSESSFHIHSVMIEKDPGSGMITAYNFDPWHGIYQLSDRSVSSMIRHRGIRPIAFLEPVDM
jgi:hypothetical protein